MPEIKSKNKLCKGCNIEKTIENTCILKDKYFSSYCKKCSYKILIGTLIIEKKDKIHCKSCGIEKTKKNTTIVKDKYFAPYCKRCLSKINSDRYYKVYRGKHLRERKNERALKYHYIPLEKIHVEKKHCKRCNIEKTTKNTSLLFNRKGFYFQSYCRECVKIIQKESYMIRIAKQQFINDFSQTFKNIDQSSIKRKEIIKDCLQLEVR